MARPNLKPALHKLVDAIASTNTYSGRKVSHSIIKQLVIEERTDGAGVLAPYWLGVLEHGRGKRKSTTDSGLAAKIYSWMQRHNLFKSTTAAGKIAEAKGVTWYINKYGNKQFRTKAFVDVYSRARKACEAEVMRDYALAVGAITKDII
jgi:hypothetical protein